jgi:acyl carrier protein
LISKYCSSIGVSFIGRVIGGESLLHHRTDTECVAAASVDLDDDRASEVALWRVAENDPSPLRTDFSRLCISGVDHPVFRPARRIARSQRCESAFARRVRRHPVRTHRGVGHSRKGGRERDGAGEPEGIKKRVVPHRWNLRLAIIADMDRAEIERKLLAIIHEQKTLPPDAIAPDTVLSDIGIDSLDALSILFAVEEQFGVSIPDDKARSIRTLDDMVAAVRELLPAS